MKDFNHDEDDTLKACGYETEDEKKEVVEALKSLVQNLEPTKNFSSRVEAFEKFLFSNTISKRSLAFVFTKILEDAMDPRTALLNLMINKIGKGGPTPGCKCPACEAKRKAMGEQPELSLDGGESLDPDKVH